MIVALLPFLYILGVLVLPLGLLAFMSTWSIDDRYRIVYSSSLDNYGAVFGEEVYTSLLLKSLWVAALVAAVTFAIAFPLAYYIATLPSAAWRRLLVALIVIPSGTSFLIRAYAWITLLGKDGLFRVSVESLGVGDPPRLLYTQWAVVIALVYTYLPFMFIPLYASVSRIDRSLLEAADNLGASIWFRLTRVVLPMAKPALAAGLLLVFVPTVGEYATPALLGGTDGQLLGTAIRSWVAQADFPLAAALSICLLAVVLGTIAVLSRWLGLARTWVEW